MKKVAILISSLETGGAERVVSRIAKPLAERYQLYIILIDGRYQAYECAGSIIRLDEKREKEADDLFATLAKARDFKRICKEYDFDAVISFLDGCNLINIVTPKRAKSIINVRCYIDIMYYPKLLSKVKYYLVKFLYKHAEQLIVVSKLMKHQMVTELHVKEDRVKVIENPYDVEEIQQLAAEDIPEEVKQFIASHRTLVCMGRITEIKGCRYLVEVVNELSEKIPDIGLLVLGKGPDLEYIKQRIAALKLEEHFMFVGVQKNPFAYLKKCKVFVSASRMEGFPNALAEAMCCGMPVISTDCKSGPREILSEGNYLDKLENSVEYAEYGILVPTIDDENDKVKVKLFADAVHTLLQDDDKMRKYAEAAQERMAVYTMDECIGKYCEVIENGL